jgi:Uma2 family endonuclease
MRIPASLHDIEYPESDGRPMGETDLHRDWIFRIIELMRQRYRGQRVYVSGDLLLYYEEGDPTKVVVPDGLVLKNSDPGRRRVFKLWQEGRAPDVVFETTSRSTRKSDEIEKPELYHRLGIKEYFLYDPTSEYLKPPLQGYRLRSDGYARIAADVTGALASQELGLLLRLEDGDLVMYDAQTGERLQTQAEAEQAASEAKDAALESERAAREAAEAKALAESEARQAAEAKALAESEARQVAEAELQRLRRQLGEMDDSVDL